MKKTLIQNPITGFILATVLAAAPMAAMAQTTTGNPSNPTPTAAVPAPRAATNVSGKVEAKSDSTLTVAGRTISITSATTFSRGGASIGSGDIKVGDKVNVVTTDNGQVAVSVEVTASE